VKIDRDLKHLPDLLRVRAGLEPDGPFVRLGDRALTYGEFDARTDRVAAGLVELGVAPGDVVSVFLPNCIEFLEAWFGIVKAGGVLGPVNPAYTGPEAAYVLNDSGAVAVVTDTNGAGIVAPEREGIEGLRHVVSIGAGGDVAFSELLGRSGATPDVTRDLDDLAALLYTSGTTGKPKGAMLSHRNQIVNAAQGAELVPLGPGDRVGLLLPLFHANAQVVTTLIPLLIGCEIVMWPKFSASKFWETVAELQPASLSAVPTILAAVLHAPGAPSGRTSLRYVICGAAPLSVELLDAFQRRFGIRILEGYGMTETACIASINPFYGDRKAGSIGLPIRGQEMRIMGSDGKPAARGDYGEIAIKGPNVMQGYLNRPEATAETIRDGWLYSGDVGYEDEDGYFYIVDRSKDMIIRGGENIYPREIEEVLYEFEGVLECAVIGIPDEIRGEEVLAVVAPKAGVTLDPDELTAHARQRLAKYKLPVRYEVLEALPKTPTGKISKGPLREEFAHPVASAK
jgi:long-chain acyl-CoA synthetase